MVGFVVVRSVAVMNPDAEPVAMRELVGRDLLGIDAEHVGDLGEQLAGGVGEVQRPLGAAEPRDGLGELGDGVVVDQARAVRGDAARDELAPRPAPSPPSAAGTRARRRP